MRKRKRRGAGKVPGHCHLFLKTMTHCFLVPISLVRPWTQGCQEGGEKRGVESKVEKKRPEETGAECLWICPVGYLLRVAVISPDLKSSYPN